GCSVAANAPAWGAGDRRRESGRPDQPFPIRSCSSVNRAPSSEGRGRWREPCREHHFRGRSSAAERLPDTQEAEGAIPSVPTIHARVAQTTEHGASNAGDEGETPSASAIFSGCNVSSRRPRSERGGRRCNSCHPDHFGWLAEQQCPGPENRVSLRAAWLRFLHHPPFPKRPVAQKQSARLISGRPRSVTAPDDQLTFRKPKTERTPMRIAKALKLK